MKVILLFIALILTNCGPDKEFFLNADKTSKLQDRFQTSFDKALNKYENDTKKKSELRSIQDKLSICMKETPDIKRDSISSYNSGIESETLEAQNYQIKCYEKAFKEIEIYL